MEEMIELKDGIRIINKDNVCYVVVDDLAKIASYKTIDYLADQLSGSHDLKTNVNGADVYIVPINKVESILSNKNLTGKLKKLKPYHKFIKDIMSKEINKSNPKIINKKDTKDTKDKDNINWLLTNINNVLVNINNSLTELVNMSKSNTHDAVEPVSNIDNIINNFNKDKEYLNNVTNSVNYDIETGQFCANKKESSTQKAGLIFHVSSNIWKYKSLKIDDPNLRTNINKNIEYIVKNTKDNPLTSTITNVYSTLYSRLANNATYPFDVKKNIYNMRRETGNYKLKLMDAVMSDTKATNQFLLLLDQLYREVLE